MTHQFQKRQAETLLDPIKCLMSYKTCRQTKKKGRGDERKREVPLKPLRSKLLHTKPVLCWVRSVFQEASRKGHLNCKAPSSMVWNGAIHCQEISVIFYYFPEFFVNSLRFCCCSVLLSLFRFIVAAIPIVSPKIIKVGFKVVFCW